MKRKTINFTWSQMAVYKLSMLCVGMAIGSYWPETLIPFAGPLLAIGIVGGVYLSYVWWNK